MSPSSPPEWPRACFTGAPICENLEIHPLASPPLRLAGAGDSVRKLTLTDRNEPLHEA